MANANHFWPLPLPLGCWATDPEGTHRGRIVAVFSNYQAALKWGAWDLTHTAPGERHDEPYYLLQVPRGALLVASRNTRPLGVLDQPPEVAPAAVRALTGKITRTAAGG